ncbi:putative secreted protein [Alloactinosynnema sp. L-07]|nr:putative secreted protein [Alloactinosynnema sp. L-07]
MILLAATATIAMTTPASATPEFTFADCPTLPAAADPNLWRCEEMAAKGTFQLGRLPELDLGTLRLTFAEGTQDGKFAQTFGALRSEEVRIPRTSLKTRLQYAGYSDFLSTDERMGELHLKLAVTGPLIPKTCTIGTDQDPIRFVVKRTAPTEVVTTNPLVVKFAIADNTFTAPKAAGCGPFGPMINHRIGLPSKPGDSSLKLATRVGIRGY